MWFGLSIPSPPARVSVTWLKIGCKNRYLTKSGPLLRHLCQIFVTRMFSFSVKIVQPCTATSHRATQGLSAISEAKACQLYLEAKEKQAEMLGSFLTTSFDLFSKMCLKQTLLLLLLLELIWVGFLLLATTVTIASTHMSFTRCQVLF